MLANIAPTFKAAIYLAIIAGLFWTSTIKPVKTEDTPIVWTKSQNPKYLPPEQWQTLPVWSPDGKMIALSHPITILDAKTYEVLPAKIPIDLGLLSWSKNCRYLIGKSSDDDTVIVELATGSITIERSMHEPAIRCAWAPQESKLALAQQEGVQIWDALNKRPANLLSTTRTQYVAVDWSPNGKWVAASSGTRDNLIGRPYLAIWDVESANTLLKLRSKESFGKVGWSPTGKYFAYCNGDLSVLVADTLNEIVTLKTNDFPHRMEFAWSNHGNKIAYKGADRRLHVFDVDKRTEQIAIVADKNGNYKYVWSPLDNYLTITSNDFITICDATTGKCLKTMPTSSFAMTQWFPDESALVVQNPNRYWQNCENRIKIVYLKHTQVTASHKDNQAKHPNCNNNNNNNNNNKCVDFIFDAIANNPWQNQRVPLTLSDCIAKMPNLIDDAAAARLIKDPERTIIDQEYYIGNFRCRYTGPHGGSLVTSLDLNSKTPLVDHFNNLGLHDPYSMANLILKAYRLKLLKQPLDLNKEVEILRSIEKLRESELGESTDSQIYTMLESMSFKDAFRRS